MCINEVRLDSKGKTKDYQNVALGKYSYYQDSYGKPSFQHNDTNLYIHWAPDDYWTVKRFNTHNCYMDFNKKSYSGIKSINDILFHHRLVLFLDQLTLLFTIQHARNQDLQNVKHMNGTF